DAYRGIRTHVIQQVAQRQSQRQRWQWKTLLVAAILAIAALVGAWTLSRMMVTQPEKLPVVQMPKEPPIVVVPTKTLPAVAPPAPAPKQASKKPVVSNPIVPPIIEKRGAIYGKVVDESGIPIPGVSVILVSRMIPSQTATTDPSGNFRFGNLPAGAYSVN